MPNAKYRAGRAAEYRAKRSLLATGYHTVIRAAGSKGPFDLIALSKGSLALVQVKRGRAISKSERAALVALKTRLPYFCTVEIWRFIVGKRHPDVEVL